MKILFLVIAPKIAASSRTRVYQYLPFFLKDKIDYKVLLYRTGLDYYLHGYWPENFFLRNLIYKFIGLCDVLFSSFQTLRLISIAKFYDIIFIQKVLLPNIVVKIIKSLYHRKIVFDFDDAIYADAQCYNKNRFDSQIPLYDLIILENEYTKRYVNERGNKNVLKITGPIDVKNYCSKEDAHKEEVVVGWIGSPSTQGYLCPCKEIFKKLSNKYPNLIFEFIGASNINLDGVRFKVKRWNMNTEISDIQNFDIGIMPLPDNEWTRGKGGYKLLQYGAVGIPSVASPIGVNNEIVFNSENGFLADSEDEWYLKISQLIEDKSLRIKMGRANAQRMKERYSYEVAYHALRESLLKLRMAKDV
ncbi:Glycosyl transferases group 1 [uncultured archaeon]|nr:Glycosyl transferases group 1 [uncultured archaeon]